MHDRDRRVPISPRFGRRPLEIKRCRARSGVDRDAQRDRRAIVHVVDRLSSKGVVSAERGEWTRGRTENVVPSVEADCLSILRTAISALLWKP